jgi:hypothetical protein
MHKFRTKFDENFLIRSSSNVNSWTNLSLFWVRLRAWVCISLLWCEMHNKFRQNHLAIIDFNACRGPTYRQVFDPWTHSLDAYYNNSEK